MSSPCPRGCTEVTESGPNDIAHYYS
uniref:Uncharacterized protein n=1 Tax=Anguilla anguilla TaxID=7936 RepID=A0A0E9UAA4_ANGAN